MYRQRPSAETYERARKLRRTMPPSEVAVWQRLRGSRLGVRFGRQHPIGPFTVDFACVGARLLVEVDGEPHAIDDSGHDVRRTVHLEARGFRAVRFDGVVAEIVRALRESQAQC